MQHDSNYTPPEVREIILPRLETNMMASVNDSTIEDYIFYDNPEE